MIMPTDDLDRLNAQAAKLLTAHAHRFTTARQHIVAALHEADSPLTILQLLDAGEGLVQSTTYRNLVVLEDAGVVTRVITPDDHARYELDEHLTHHHHHLICNDCGDVKDFELSDNLENKLDGELQEAGRTAGFRIERHSLDLFGTCKSCS